MTVKQTLLTAASSLEPAVETVGDGVTPPASPSPAAEPTPRPQPGVTPTCRNCRHSVADDGSMDTDEDSLAKAMRRKATHNLDNQGGIDFTWISQPSGGRSGGILLGVNTWTMNVLASSDGEFHVKLHIRNKADNFTWTLVVMHEAA